MIGARHARRAAGIGLVFVAALAVTLAAAPALAQEANVYRQFLGLDSRRLVWFLAQMHLFFAETFLLYLYDYGWNWLQGTAPFSQPLGWALKGLAMIALVAGATLFFGLWGPEMRGDNRSFIVLLYFLPLAVGLYITRTAKAPTFSSAYS